MLLAINPATSSGQIPDISWYTIDGGGGLSVRNGFELVGTSGQPDAGLTLTGGGFALTGGFHVPIQVAVVLGDVNLDGAVNLLDVDFFVDRVATGTFQPEADCNQDGEVNLLDIDRFIASLSGA